MLLLADGDILAYRAAAACSEYVSFEGDEEGTWITDLAGAIEKLDEDIEKALDLIEPDKFVVPVSDSLNFRTSFFPAYKANRDPAKRPPILSDVKKYLQQTYDAPVWKHLEADDVIGIVASSNPEAVIWSLDKDLYTIPGRMIRAAEIEEGYTVVETSEAEADWFWMYQTLTGDAADNYKGCPGIGPKRAEKILQDCTTLEEMWEAVVEAYRSKGFGPRLALQQARCARILRAPDWNPKTCEVRLWEPRFM